MSYTGDIVSDVTVTKSKLNTTLLFHADTFGDFPSSNFAADSYMMDDETGEIYKNEGTYATPSWVKKLKLSDAIYGPGADGDLTVSTPASITGAKYYNNLTVDASQTLGMPAPTSNSILIIKVADTLTLNGTISVDGKGGAGGPGGAGGTGRSNPSMPGAAETGGPGGTGTASQGINDAANNGSAGAASPGPGGPGGPGGAGGAASSTDLSLLILADQYSNIPFVFGAGGGGGGGGGGGDRTSPAGSGGPGGTGGVGGYGGGGLYVFAKNIVIGPAGLFSAAGLAGSPGSPGNPGSGSGIPGGAGGPGGGGSGGAIIIIYDSLTNNRTPAPSAYNVAGPGGSGFLKTLQY